MVDPRLVVAIVSLILAFVSGWMVKGWQTDAKTLQAYQIAVEKGNEMSKSLEDSLAKLEANKFVVKSEVRHETVKQVYSDCKIPPEGIALFNQSASSGNEF